jgi:hypothetical protein
LSGLKEAAKAKLKHAQTRLAAAEPASPVPTIVEPETDDEEDYADDADAGNNGAPAPAPAMAAASAAAVSNGMP